MHQAFRDGFEKQSDLKSVMLNNPRLAGTIMHALPGAAMGAAGGAAGGALMGPEDSRGESAALGAIGGGLVGGIAGGAKGFGIGDEIRSISHHHMRSKGLDPYKHKYTEGIPHEVFAGSSMVPDTALAGIAGLGGGAAGGLAHRYIKGRERNE